jgi:thioesterase domain-containing protein
VAREKEKTLLLSVEELRQLSYEQQLEHFLAQVKNAHILDQDIPEDTGVQYVHRFLEGYKARQIAMRRYKPMTYSGVITLFRCQEQDPVTIEDLRRAGINLEEQTYGWAGLSTEPVKVHLVSGTHETMCMEPHVDTLATIISGLIEEKTVVLV